MLMNYFQGKLNSAIQQFREALQEDFSYLEPLYNLSLIYRRQQLYDAELESLNLLVTVSIKYFNWVVLFQTTHEMFHL